MTNGDVRVMVASASFSDDALKPCWPAAASVAGRCGLSVPTVKRGWSKGCQLGYVSRYDRKRRRGKGRERHLQGASIMYFTFPKKIGNDTASEQDFSQETAGATPDHRRRITSDTPDPKGSKNTASGGVGSAATPPATATPNQELIERIDALSSDALAVLVHRWPFYGSPYAGLVESEMSTALRVVREVEAMSETNIFRYLERNQ